MKKKHLQRKDKNEIKDNELSAFLAPLTWGSSTVAHFDKEKEEKKYTNLKKYIQFDNRQKWEKAD